MAKYILFEVIKNETHYVERYEEDTCIYLTPDEKEAQRFTKSEARKIMKRVSFHLFMEKAS